jgi:Tfp pilus assembly protein PilV
MNKSFIKNKNIYFKNKQGFMLVEVVVVTAIIIVSVLAAMSVTQKSVYVSRQALHISQASFLLEEGAEVVRILRDSNWTNISSLIVGTSYYPTYSSSWSLSTTSSNVGSFTRTVTIASVSRDATTGDIVSFGGVDDTGTKLITVNVSWLEGGVTLNKSLSFYIMDIFSS